MYNWLRIQCALQAEIQNEIYFGNDASQNLVDVCNEWYRSMTEGKNE